ncbi:MAG: RecQ family ATP-dependent DNA helicase, partial [Gammaproteobacteria bacterium]|nr:RecQ family ATP-dependent DNA helicase [Gammaproteobacteria bacterium]
MDTLRYTASARLGVWDSLTRRRDEFLDELARILQDNSHAVLEADHIEELCPTANPSLESVTAICDKIIARGNPTLVDLEFEHTLLKGPCQQYLSVEELGEEEPNVGFKFSKAKFPGNRDVLFRAAKDLLCLPYRNETESSTDTRELPPDLTDLTSEEEDLFAEQFRTAFGEYLGTKLHRQVLIRDLVNRVDNNLEQSRVDFVFQSDSIRWVFEVDGQQHNEPGQRGLDKQRDDRLKENGWVVHRIPAEDVRQGLENLFEGLRKELAQVLSTEYDSVQTAIAKSEVHAAAFNSILLPLAVQRCLRGLLFLYSHEILDPTRQQRILIIEEDCPVAAEAFRILCAIWTRIHTLVSDISPAPKLKLDVIGEKPNWGKTDAARYRDAPDNNYDLILSHSLLLDTDCIGSTEKTHFPNRPRNFICLRRAIGLRAERSLQACNALHYDLADIEQAISSQNRGNPEPMPYEKHEALLFFLRHIFRKRNFWDGQLHVIARLLQGKASIVLLPTGGGKSLTYQLSGLLLPGMTIIIDPLVSLMDDQVENLKTAGIDLIRLVSGQQDPESKEAALQNMESGQLAFILIAPERLQTKDFRSRLQTVVNHFPVSLAVIDEAHCVSEWGHDFRPSYLHMPRNLQNYCSSGRNGHKPTLVGLTGTASFAVLADIQMEMQVIDEEAIILPRSFDRKELRFRVINVPMSEKSSKLKALKKDLPRSLRANAQKFYDPRGDHTNSGIVFCPHVNGSLGVISVAKILGHRNFYAGEKPKIFGDSWPDHKKAVQRNFKRNHIQEIVATKSFGMGIDKPNIRYTIHYTVPQSIEAFYQEAGRAGRNGKLQNALCSILYS